MGQLPSNALLMKIFQAEPDTKDAELAERYGVTPQAVSARRRRLGVHARPLSARISSMLPWDLGQARGFDPHGAYPYISLRGYMRRRLGDEALGYTLEGYALSFYRKLVSENVVLAFSPGARGIRGFHYLPRIPRDGNLVIRWPGVPPMLEGEAKVALTLPSLEDRGAWEIPNN